MRMIETDIGNSGELHRLYVEYSKDMGRSIPNPDFWLVKFRDPTFYCLLAKHGKRPVGFVMGNTHPYFDKPAANVEAFFIRRGFRKFRFIRSTANELLGFLRAMKISTVVYTRVKSKEKSIG